MIAVQGVLQCMFLQCICIIVHMIVSAYHCAPDCKIVCPVVQPEHHIHRNQHTDMASVAKNILVDVICESVPWQWNVHEAYAGSFVYLFV